MDIMGGVQGHALQSESGSIPDSSTTKIKVKELIVKTIDSSNANKLVKRLHYSGKVVNNSTLHFGVFHKGKLLGVMQFGNPMMKKNVIGLVSGTKWSGFIELNRMAFSELLPKNSESRCLSVALRIIKKQYEHIEWVLSYSDATQSGDGCIYRAVGFLLTGIKKNTGIRVNPKTGGATQAISAYHKGMTKEFINWEPLKGFQLRYIYPMNEAVKNRITCDILDYTEIKKANACMYRGKKICQDSVTVAR